MSSSLFYEKDSGRVDPTLPPVADAVVLSETAEPVDAPVEQSQAKGIGRFFKRRGKPGKAGAQVERPAAAQVVAPIQVFMGYLPEVSERDALEYAMGMADKYVTQDGLTFYAATKLGTGYLYELHEGGAGKSFGPEIVRWISEAGPFNPENPGVLHVRTATRTLEVTREREGVAVVLLPDEAELGESPVWVTPRKSMRPGVPRRIGMLYAGIGLLVSGTIAAVLTGYFFRLQGYAAPPAQPVVTISAEVLPMSQWTKVENLEHVKALRYKDGAWQAPEIYTEAELNGEPAPDETVPESVEKGVTP